MGEEPAPRWVADEMLGRLARYLRFFGHDVLYVRGLPDAEIARLARREGRTLLTRDRELAHRTPSAILLGSPILGDQLREVRSARPHAGFTPTFDRCPECNDPLEPWARRTPGALRSARPSEVPPPGAEVFACRRCGRRYWEGSHTRMIRQRVDAWLAEAPA